MRRHFVSLVALLGLFGVFAYLALVLKEQGIFYFHDAGQDVESYLSAFREAHQPLMEINLADLYGRGGQIEVLDPQFDVKRLPLNLPKEMCASGDAMAASLNRGAIANCSRDGGEPGIAIPEAKQIAIERYLNAGDPLNDEWMTSPPLVSASGESYAYILTQTGRVPFNQSSWVAAHLSLFKTSELKEVMAKYRIQYPQYAAIAEFQPDELKDLIKGLPLVLTKNYLMIKNQSRLGFSPLSYWVYDVRELQSALRNDSHDLVAYTTGSYCLQRIGNSCWTYNSKTALAYVYRYAVAILILLALGCLLYLGFYLRSVREKNREQQRQRLSLQVLSHEFRTPVSSMLLLLEQLTQNPNRFEVSDQDLMIRVSSEVYRLQRIVEMSKNYLRAGSHLARFNLARIPSINAWITEFATELDPRIHCQLLKEDQAIEADIFWLKFILENLVQNAFAHGNEPVSIKLAQSRGRIYITVEDQGVCEFNSLQEMSEPFVKSSRSKGMGLGLNITKLIVDESGGKLDFAKYPTSFTLSWNQESPRQ